MEMVTRSALPSLIPSATALGPIVPLYAVHSSCATLASKVLSMLLGRELDD